MIGFLAAFTGELRAGESVFSQMVSGGLGQMLIVILAVTVASFAPAISGVREIPAAAAAAPTRLLHVRCVHCCVMGPSALLLCDLRSTQPAADAARKGVRAPPALSRALTAALCHGHRLAGLHSTAGQRCYTPWARPHLVLGTHAPPPTHMAV